MRATTMLALVASMAVVGCNEAASSDVPADAKAKGGDESSSKEKEKSPPPKTPEGVKLSFEAGKSGASTKIKIDNTQASGDIGCFSLECTVRITKLPEGTKVKVGEHEGTADARSVSVPMDIAEAVGNGAPKDVLAYDKTLDTKVTVEITFPDGVKISGTVPPVTVKYAVEKEMQKLLNGTPVLFGKEAEAAPAQHTIFFPGVGSQPLEGVLGPAKTMKEIDWVAVEQKLPERSADKKCSGYRATGETGPGKDANLFLVDSEVRLVERKTGKVLDTKKFEAKGGCPMFASGDKATQYVARDAIMAWLRTKR
jgi:hypothetical protein